MSELYLSELPIMHVRRLLQQLNTAHSSHYWIVDSIAGQVVAEVKVKLLPQKMFRPSVSAV